MRRPSPLPQPPVKPGAAASTAPSTPEDEQSSVRPPDSPTPSEIPIVESDDASEHETAPIIPLDASVLATDPDDASDATAPEEADAAVSARDVWNAARARRKALRAEVRRFTGRQRRRRAMWIGVAASLVLLVGVTFGAAYSPLFAVERITVTGAQALDVAAVEAALAEQIGTPLALIDDSEVKAALVGFPLVESYTLEARPPHELVVRIVERTPIGYIESRAGFTLVDAAGVALATTPQAGSDAPLLSIDDGLDSASFEAAGYVMRALPTAIRSQVTGVTAATPDDVRLTLGGQNVTIVWGSSEESAKKALVLEAAMVARPPATVSVYDVSSPQAVVVQ